jgi:hypothetical protein
MTPRGGVSRVQRAFDELQFGAGRTLDLRAALPTPQEAESRTEKWLRERQVSVGGEVLIVTGRGRGSDAGIAVVRPVVEKRLARLTREGVVASVRTHTAGSFVVTLAPIGAMLSASARRKDAPRGRADGRASAALQPLGSESLALLRELACRSLDALGAPATDTLVQTEMLHQFSRLSKAVPDGPDREAGLRRALESALSEITGA